MSKVTHQQSCPYPAPCIHARILYHVPAPYPCTVHPASTTHANLSQDERDALALSDGFIRLSVGLEDKDDLWADIDQALSSVS